MMASDKYDEITLTRTEQRILQMVAEGRTSPQIASELCLSLPTIKWYRKKLRGKFGVTTTMQMVRKALDMKLI